MQLTAHFVDASFCVQGLLWLGFLVAGLQLRAEHPGAGGRLAAGAGLLLVVQAISALWMVLLRAGPEVGLPDAGVIAATSGCLRPLQVVLHTVGLALVAWAAAVGRRAWYEEDPP